MGEEKNTKWKYVPDMGHHMLPQAEICCRDQDEKLVAAQISEEQAVLEAFGNGTGECGVG